MHGRWEHPDLVAEARQRPACLGNEELYCSLYACVSCVVYFLCTTSELIAVRTMWLPILCLRWFPRNLGDRSSTRQPSNKELASPSAQRGVYQTEVT